MEAAFLEGAVGWEEYQSAMRDLALDTVFQDQSPQISEEAAATLGAWLMFCRNDLMLCGTNGLTNFSRS